MSAGPKDERPCIVCGEPISASRQAFHIAAEHSEDATGESA